MEEESENKEGENCDIYVGGLGICALEAMKDDPWDEEDPWRSGTSQYTSFQRLVANAASNALAVSAQGPEPPLVLRVGATVACVPSSPERASATATTNGFA